MVILSTVPVILWLVAAPLSERFGGENAETFEAIAMVFGIAGASAFGLNLILGARLPFVQKLFGGLEELYRSHRGTGRAVLYLLLLHTVFLVASHWAESPSAVLDVFNPGEEPVAFIGLLALLGLVIGIFLTLRARLKHEWFIYVQRFFGIVFLEGALHFFQTDDVKEVPALRTYLLILTELSVAAFLYRSVFGSVLVARRKARITNVKRLDPTVAEITLMPDKKIEFIPGQFVFANFYSPEFTRQFDALSFSPKDFHIRPGQMKHQFHPFSITSSPVEPELKLAVKVVGDYTSAVHNLQAGALALIEGPYGSFSHRSAPNRRQVWIAGGIGVTPFLSMARSLGSDHDIHLFYCVTNLPEAHFQGEFENVVATPGTNLRMTLHLSEVSGFITADVVEAQVGGLQDKDIFMCGPPVMIEGLEKQFASKGVPGGRIHAERFGFGPSRAVRRNRPPNRISASRPAEGRWRSIMNAALAGAFAAAVAFSAALLVKLAL